MGSILIDEANCGKIWSVRREFPFLFCEEGGGASLEPGGVTATQGILVPLFQVQILAGLFSPYLQVRATGADDGCGRRVRVTSHLRTAIASRLRAAVRTAVIVAKGVTATGITATGIVRSRPW